MGLDVSLKYCKDRATELAKQEAAEKFSSEAWEKLGLAYDAMSEAQKETTRAAIKAYNDANGLDEWGSSDEIIGIEENSAQFPEHMFKVGYLRSSYNSGGINSVLKRTGCMDLYDIFEPKGDDYYTDINWAESKERCEQAIAKYREHLSGDFAGYDVIRVTDFGHGGATDDAHALELLKNELRTRGADSFRSYGNREGDWYLDGVNVVGIVPNRGFGGGMFILTKDKDVKVPEDDWYMQALMVTNEMIDFVLSKEDPENYFVSWSA